jgi:hypothetical protein
MKIYWITKSIPEVAHLSSSKCAEAIAACKWKAFRHRETWMAVGVCILLGVLGQMLGLWLRWNMNVYRYILPPIVGMLGIIIGVAIESQVMTEQMRPYLREYVATHFANQ